MAAQRALYLDSLYEGAVTGVHLLGPLAAVSQVGMATEERTTLCLKPLQVLEGGGGRGGGGRGEGGRGEGGRGEGGG